MTTINQARMEILLGQPAFGQRAEQCLSRAHGVEHFARGGNVHRERSRDVIVSTDGYRDPCGQSKGNGYTRLYTSYWCPAWVHRGKQIRAETPFAQPVGIPNTLIHSEGKCIPS